MSATTQQPYSRELLSVEWKSCVILYSFWKYQEGTQFQLDLLRYVIYDFSIGRFSAEELLASSLRKFNQLNSLARHQIGWSLFCAMVVFLGGSSHPKQYGLHPFYTLPHSVRKENVNLWSFWNYSDSGRANRSCWTTAAQRNELKNQFCCRFIYVFCDSAADYNPCITDLQCLHYRALYPQDY